MLKPTYTHALASLLLLCFTACANVPVDGAAAPIVGGTPGGNPAVVWVYRSDGALCSGTLIHPRVVLTAKHCVQASGASGPSAASAFTVGFGDTAGGGGEVERVQSVFTTPGVWSEGGAGGISGALVGMDVGVLVLVQGVSDVTPIPIMRTSPAALTGTTFTATGFGEIPSGGAGHKYTAMGRVTGVSTTDHLIYVGDITCEGDSGGPLITADNMVGGVVSFGTGGGTCGTGYGAYQAIDAYLSLIDMAVAMAGECLMNGPEVCDGYDNDCNGLVDETCSALGQGCSNDADCVGGMCRATSAGQICTASCDARRPTFGCETGLFCSSLNGCDGYCVPITGDHTLPNDAPCMTSSQCASFLCVDPGDHNRRCLSPCVGNAGQCPSGEACVAQAGACGGCVPAEILAAARGLGEPCTADAQCASMHCLTDGGRQYCSAACTDDAACGNGYHCRTDHCVAGDRGQAGDTCEFDTMQQYDDCDTSQNLFCARLGHNDWCSEFCGPSTTDDHMCPTGFDCVDTGAVHVCAPMSSLLGSSCTTNDDCISQLCVTSSQTNAMVCSHTCSVDSPCSTGFACVRGADGTSAYCLANPPVAAPSHGGCSVAVESRGRFAPWLLALSLLVVVRSFRARRAARR